MAKSNVDLDRLEGAFRRHFGEEPHLLVRAPGRVNLIGEHTDYNDGFVLPMAIDRDVRIALRRIEGRQVRVYSLDFEAETRFDLAQLEPGGGWGEYLKGVAWALQQDGIELGGFEGVMSGDVPRGSGLSSSAAVEMATARAFIAANELPWDPKRMARLCQLAENEWLNVKSGIMDQLVSATGRAGHAVLIDCRSLDLTPVPLPPGTAVLVLDTATRRGLVDSAYNERRQQCDEAAATFGVPALRDVSLERFEAEAARLGPLLRKRARHVVSENARTLLASEVMQAGDAARLGLLMNQSHVSLRDDFEVSSPALDAIVDCAQRMEGCFGARLTGAGFGGCAVALVSADRAEAIAGEVAECYRRATGREPQVYRCQAAAGAEELTA